MCYDEQQKLKQSIKQSLEKEYYRMQTLYRKNPTKLSPQTRKIATGAILLFALSGLISGFAVGAFVHLKPATGTTHNTGSGTKPIAQNTRTPVITSTLTPVKLGWPVFQQPFTFRQIANGTTFYTVTIQVVDRSIDASHGNPVHATGITCKIWLTKDANVSGNIQTGNDGRLKSVDTINQPFPGEIVGALNFDPSTQQVRLSDANGQATWKYTISTSVDPGSYQLVVLADWNGIHYNWSWANIEIKKAG